MKLAKALLVIASILVTGFFMISSDTNYTGAITFCLLLWSLFFAFFMDKPLASVLLMIISLHWFQLDGMTITLYFIPVAVILFLLYALNRRELRMDKPILAAVALVFGHMGLVLLTKPFPIEYIFFYINAVCFVFFWGSSLFKWDSAKVQTILNAHLAFMVGWGFVERVVSSAPRIEGPALSSTNFAVMLVVAWTIWLVNGLLERNYKWTTLGIGSLLVLVVVLFSGTRMGILGMGLCGVLMIICKLYLKYERQVMRFLVYFTISFAAFCAFAYVVWRLLPDDLFLKQGMMTFLSGKLDMSSLGRLGAWATALDIIRTDPMWGVGPGNFLVRNKMLLDSFSMIPVVEITPRLGHAHNVFLLVLSEQGFVGFAVLGSFCLVGLYYLLRCIRRYKSGLGLALLCGGIVTLFLGMFDVFPLFPSSLVWGAWYMSVLYSLRGYKGEPDAKLPETKEETQK
ncbi:MAG: O-antigen ligase family protein [Fibrobacter sp.]|uniref:O-antigen ligase family protein n=1 Tax=Fibrobacter sp. TaxID=35828 RepID=UPI0025B9BAA9|nr:O-antigen ligase family protein [Fibrobacter sp.]MBR4785552.1 O-antigen ligase family protein [Fibrobacter sp.]